MNTRHEILMNEILADLENHSPQGSALWDRIRLGKFTASGIWQLMSDARSKSDRESGRFSQTGEKYIVEKVVESISGMSNDESFGRAIDHGNEFEETALTELSVQLNSSDQFVTGSFVMKPPFRQFNDDSGGSADALIKYKVDSEIIDVGVEMKCPFNMVNHFWHTQVNDAESLKEINSNYYWQCLMNCLAYRCRRWIFASFDPRMPNDRLRLHWSFIDPPVDDLTELCERIERASKRKHQLISEMLKK